MPHPTRGKRKVKYRKLTIEVEESVALRLDEMAAKYPRYQGPEEVASEAVSIYLGLLEEVEERVSQFVEKELRKHVAEQERQHLAERKRKPRKR